ncbi:hypothetical protein A1O3_06528 [Capronia epimyces CBS 606.96]|uniref:Uncharacterized protein n=1 Tax=Capronia epimyces CBS 606.96 TaxID=1182542 RepID=W9YKC0_9EURO|nr:uncharacterized protein A1O3_06528 [Capronia epimyces CBS 606.96]EXJ82714.1 hypothetical protein A1O3_06528 [Capronia epimyces CBS 606.96]
MLPVPEAEFAQHLRTLNIVPLSHHDGRSDDEMIRILCNPPAVFSERNGWSFWDGGFTNMRPWSQGNVVGWVR